LIAKFQSVAWLCVFPIDGKIAAFAAKKEGAKEKTTERG